MLLCKHSAQLLDYHEMVSDSFEMKGADEAAQLLDSYVRSDQNYNLRMEREEAEEEEAAERRYCTSSRTSLQEGAFAFRPRIPP